MIFDWYKIFNLTDFLALGLVSKSYRQTLAGIGSKTILVTKGNMTGMVYEGVFLPLNLAGRSPFIFEGLAIYKNASNDVFLGVLV